MVPAPNDCAERQRQQARLEADHPGPLDHQALDTSRVGQASCVRHTCLHRWDFQHGVHDADHGEHSHPLGKGHTVGMKALVSVAAVGSSESRERFAEVAVLGLWVDAEKHPGWKGEEE